MPVFNRFLPYDVYERHTVVAGLLEQVLGAGRVGTGILDVGGRVELLTRFLPDRIISINPDGSGDLIAAGQAIPFADDGFEAVVSIDTLEHLPKAARLPFLQECLRVARRAVVMAAPFGTANHIADERALNRLFASVHGQPHPYLSEHIAHGLPDLDELDRLTAALAVRRASRYFAGDYTWLSRIFRRGVAGHGKRGLRRLFNAYNYYSSLALFHPLRLQAEPYPKANRFYLILEK